MFKFKRNIYLLNGGVSGNNSIHSLLNFIGKGIPLKPEYSVLMQNGTDLSLLRKSGSYWSAPHSRTIIQISSTDQTTLNLLRIIARNIKNFVAPNIWGFFRAKINEKNLLNFYLSSITAKEFSFKPNKNTKEEIWRYLNASNLIKLEDASDKERLKELELAANQGQIDEEIIFKI